MKPIRQATLQFLTHNELKALLAKAKQRSLRDFVMVLLAYPRTAGIGGMQHYEAKHRLGRR